MYFYLHSTKVTKKGMTESKKALPNCEMDNDFDQLGVPVDTRLQRKHYPAVLDRKWPQRQGSLSIPYLFKLICKAAIFSQQLLLLPRLMHLVAPRRYHCLYLSHQDQLLLSQGFPSRAMQ